jgi:CheY-like chemotaxis protein
MARIVVIDDQVEMRQVVRRMLETAGHEVLDASDGEIGLRLLERTAVDVVITDIFMPGQDGIVTVRRIRKEFPQVKIIVMSGGAMGGALDLLRDAALLGQAKELKKPFTLPELLATVRESLGSPRAAD